MPRAYIGLGANLGDPPAQLRRAIEAIRRLDGVRLVAESPFYRTDPIGPPGQPDYCNAVVAVDAEVAAEALLARLVEIERALGKRSGGPRWGARCIDLDLLIFGQLRVETPHLTLPHPGIAARNFVLRPLRDLAPELEIPGGPAVGKALDAVGMAGIRPWGGGDA